jgi:hypothetical protein
VWTSSHCKKLKLSQEGRPETARELRRMLQQPLALAVEALRYWSIASRVGSVSSNHGPAGLPLPHCRPLKGLAVRKQGNDRNWHYLSVRRDAAWRQVLRG